MRLSMWNLADRLSGHKIRLDIYDGSADITGVRFFSEELSEFLPEYVYIGRASDVIADVEYKSSVMLVHGYDIMFIEDESIETVLNEILSAFDYYNKWEASLWASLGEENAIQRMVDISAAVCKAPMAVSDATGHVVAYTKAEGPHLLEEGWRYLIESGWVPHSYTSSVIVDSSGNILSDWTDTPQIYHMDNRVCIGARIVVDGESVAAFYMQEFDKKLTPGDVQLARVFCGVLAEMSSMGVVNSGIKSGSAAISAILDGAPLDERICARLNELIGDTPPYHLILIRSATASTNIVRKSTLLETIRQAGSGGVSLIYGDDIICVVHSNGCGAFLDVLGAHVEPAHYTIGVSMPFDGWEKLLSRYRQADFAIDRADGRAGTFFCRDFAFAYLLENIGSRSRELELAHPALDTLASYDTKNGTEMYRTLERYLTNERNTVQTAQELCIHRNSMKYRIRRIRELIGCDPDDPEERLYMLLSYRLA